MSSLANKPGTKSFRVIWAAALRLIHKCSSNTDIAVENELEQLVSTASNTSDNVLSTLLTFADEQGDTLLHHAARAHCVRALAWLLKQGASPHVMNRRARQPLHEAIDDVACVRLLLDAHAQIDCIKHGNWTPLHLAAMKCHDEVVALLLQYGASPILLTKDGRTALHLAVSVSAEELQQGKVTLAALESVVEQLLSVAPSLASMHSQNGRLPIHMAAQAGHATVVRKLLAYAPDTVTVRDHGGVDPFLAACIGGHISIARELLKYPAVSANSADKTGRNALHLAAMIGHIEILDEALQVWHLPLDQPDHWDGWTPFHYAAKEGRTVVIQHMLTFATVSGMDIVKILDIRDRHQRTASDVAKLWRQEKVVQQLTNENQFE